MLEDLTLATFADRLGETFRVGEGSDTLELELAEASAGIGGQGAGRAPFSIVFRGPLVPVLPQQIYRFDHQELGPFDLFIVPIGPAETGIHALTRSGRVSAFPGGFSRPAPLGGTSAQEKVSNRSEGFAVF
jgi:hypothetical protein